MAVGGTALAATRCGQHGRIPPFHRQRAFFDTAEQEASSVVDAWQKAIGAAIDIAKDQVCHGAPFFGAEITLEEGNKQIGRYVVTVGASPLKD